MKKLLCLLLLSVSAFAQTYVVIQNGCGAKNLGYCTLSVKDSYGQPFDLVLDTRVTGTGPIDTLAIRTPYPGTDIVQVHGDYSGFVPNPNGTKQAYYGSGAFVSDDGTLKGTFSFYAYYVGTCSGRGCGGAVVGWHYQVLSGSSVNL